MANATQALTVLAEILPGPTPRAELDFRLAEIAAHPEANRFFQPGAVPDTHFMRFVIIDDPRGELPSVLAWESNHDGEAEAYLHAVAEATPEITHVFECCADYPAAGTALIDAWVAWMCARSRRAGAFYTAYRGVPRKRVVNDREVHDAIRAIIDGDHRDTLCAQPRHEIQRQLHRRLCETRKDLVLAYDDNQELRWFVSRTAAVLGAALLLPVLLVLALPWYLALRRKETTDIASAYTRPVELDPSVRELEDHGLQNQLTHIVDIKPGAFRLATLWFVLTAIDLAARVYSVRGDLGGITAIHFARWVILPDPRPPRDGVARRHRLLFFSNYDGSWESYLGEFIDRASYGLTAVWSNTRGFPATEHLVFEGARNEEAFKQWTREHQIATQVWWSGAPDSTVQNIRDDIWIRRHLKRGLSEAELLTWLRKL
jgi:hypothetical protein